MKCNFTPLLVLTLMILAGSCKKAYDYVEQNPFATCDACKVKQVVMYTAGTNLLYNVTYDKKDRMTKMVTDQGISGIYNFYFRYDNKNRLTDYIITQTGADYAIEWRTYQYYPNKITDTLYVYWGGPMIGTSSSPAPSPDFPDWAKLVEVYSQDSKGRITKNEIFRQGVFDHQFTYSYNNNNNLIYSPTPVYDNKINPYRTNPVWQLTQLDYSANNAYYVNGDRLADLPLAGITKYNTYGLPTKYVANNAYSNRKMFGIIIYDSLDVIYDCDLSNVKVK